jgi:hypothetical protein
MPASLLPAGVFFFFLFEIEDVAVSLQLIMCAPCSLGRIEYVDSSSIACTPAVSRYKPFPLHVKTISIESLSVVNPE